MKAVQFLPSLVARLPRRARTPVLTAVAGLGAGFLAVLFQMAMNGIYQGGLVPLSKQGVAPFAVGSFVLIVVTSLAAGWLMSSFCREAAGSGIPQLKAALWKDFGYVKLRVVWVKFLAGALQIGGGSSMGREGPSVQMAGGVGSNLTGLLGEPKQRRRLGAATGAAAGLAAAFNTPLAAVTFVLEELIGDLNSRLLGSVLFAGVLGALVAHGILGPQPAFALAPLGEANWQAYVLIPLVAAVASLAGVFFQKWSMGLRLSCRQWQQVPMWMRPAVGALICWALGLAVFWHTGRVGVFALGYGDLSDALAGKMFWGTAAMLLTAKLFATVACYGTGGCGGIFSPTLFFGAMAGVLVAGGANYVLPLTPNDVVMLAVVGMSATLGAVVRAPVTSILIVFEMTHQFAIVPPLMLTALISQAITRSFLKQSFYDELLEQDGHDVERLRPLDNLRAWQEQPVRALANPRPVVLPTLEEKEVRAVLAKHPYARYPVIRDGAPLGMLEREEAELAFNGKREPRLQPVVVVEPDAHLSDIQNDLLESPTGALVVRGVGPEGGFGLLTIHDLLRAQQAAAENPADF
ncbi:MAG TPA: chloride channel protein [Verrucomicrobiae bacterium]|nr:chloride channel protein [Verrucomicrobiae bacterium]